jgi:YkoY family integral membrane protein
MIDIFTGAADLWTSIKEGLPVIMSLIMIEGLLSVDNALAIAAMAAHLEDKQRRSAMNIGYLGAYGFRLLALVFTALITHNHYIMLAGAWYLLWLMVSHFAEQITRGGKQPVDGLAVLQRSFASTVVMISLMDLSLSVDNVVTAVALSPDKMLYVYIGVTIGIITLRIVAGIAVKLIQRYPVLEHTAFLLVGYVGVLLLLELHGHPHFDRGVKFIGILIIITVTMLWSQVPWLQRAVAPLLKVIGWPLQWVAVVIWGVLDVLAWPFKTLLRALRG